MLAYFAINSGIALALRALFPLIRARDVFCGPCSFWLFWRAWLSGAWPPVIWIVVAIFFGLNAILAAAQYILLRPRLAREGECAVADADRRLVSRWRREGAPQIAVAIYTLLFADLAILFSALVLDQAALAAFGIALKLALLVGFGVQVAHQVMLPDLADAHAARRLSGAREDPARSGVFPPRFHIGGALCDDCLRGLDPRAVSSRFRSRPRRSRGSRQLSGIEGRSRGLRRSCLMVSGAQGFSAGLCLASAGVLAVGNIVFVPVWGLMGAGLGRPRGMDILARGGRFRASSAHGYAVRSPGADAR